MNSSSILRAYSLLLVSCLYVSLLTLGVAVADDHGHGHGDDRSGGQAHEHHEHEEDEADESQGFKLSQEAFKNFGIQLKKAEPGVPMTLPKTSIFFGLQEKNLYRYRGGFFKRIDFKTLSKTKTEMTVSSDDLQSGDQIATEGLGFLRIAELAAFGGVAEGHSH